MPLPLLALPIAAAAGGAAIEAIPSFLPNAATRENKRRLEELQKMQELGTLGLTEEEKQSIFGSQQAQIQGALQSSQAQARAAGAAGMQGAGAAQLQAAKAAETQANLVAQAQRGLEAANIQRKRELEQEIQARIAAKAEKSQERAAAIAKIGSAGFEAGMEELGLSSITGGSRIGSSEISNAAKELGMSEEAVSDMLRKILESGDLQSYTNLVGE
jgi:hypothetical protein